MKNNKTIFYICAAYAVIAVLAAGFYFWNSMSWSGETAKMRKELEEIQGQIVQLDADAETRRQEMQERWNTAAQEDLESAEQLRSTKNKIDEDTEFLRSTFGTLIQEDFRSHCLVPDGRGTANLRKRLMEELDLEADSSFLRNLCPDTFYLLNDIDGFDDWPVDAYLYDNLQVRLLNELDNKRDYFVILEYRVSAIFIDWSKQMVGFYATITEDGSGKVLQIGEGFRAGVIL